MDSANAQVQIRAWASVGLMKPNSVLERLDERIKDYGGLSDDEANHLRRNFDLISETENRFTKAAFAGFLQSKLHLSADFVEALNIIFHALHYLGNSPFQPRTTDSEGMTFNELTRSLAWTLPRRQERFLEASNFCRPRTPADHRRLIFESLATSLSAKDIPFDVASAKALAYRNATTFEKASMDGLGEINFDEDGDEMYHDVLDVLYSTQPTISPAYAPARRNDFRTIAKSIHDGSVRLHERTILRAQFECLLKLLLARHLELESSQSSSDFEDAACCIANAFCQATEVEGVTWPMFDFAVVHLVPQLLDPVYHLLSRSLLDRYCDEITNPSPPPSSVGTLLTLARLSQLSTFLSESVYFGDLQCFQSWSTFKPDAAELMKSVSEIPESALLVISGSTSTGEKCVFGSFVAAPSRDGTRITERERDYWEKTLLFQLSPTHDVFRGILGKPAWEMSAGGVLFGNSASGVSLSFDAPLGRTTLRHTVGAAGADPVYRPTEWRGNWELDVDIEEVELWGEVS